MSFYPLARWAKSNATIVDEVLNPWARTNGLHVAREYKDHEVRSVQVVHAAGMVAQLWIEQPQGDRVTVGCAGEGKRHVVDVEFSALSVELDNCLSLLRDWARAKAAPNQQ